MIINIRTIGKAAFAAGLGIYLGVYAGRGVEALTIGLAQDVKHRTIDAAKKGNQTAEKIRTTFWADEEKFQDSFEMGFHG